MSKSRIVVGVDGMRSSAGALRWAAAQADAKGAELVAVHVYDSPHVVGIHRQEQLAELEAVARVQVRGWVEDALGTTRAAAVLVDVVAGGDPGPVLVDAASHADLLVLGVRGYGKSRYLTVPKIARFCIGRSRAPVVVVPVAAPLEVARSAS